MDFSIIIPAKNEESNIGNCLDSINAMEFDRSRYEVLLIDNGSSDRTVEVAREKGAKVFVKPDFTISGLRNFGASEAGGRVLAFLDADCTVGENWLMAASIYLDRPDVVSFGSPAVLPFNSTWVQKTWFHIRRKRQVVEEVDWHESANVFVRREAFERVGGFNEVLITCEDYDLSFRLKRLGELLADSRIIAVHHREPATLKEFYSKESWRGTSNFQGLLSHGIDFKELPSLVIPVAYWLVGLLLIASFLSAPLFSDGNFPYPSIGILLVWQLPLALLAAWKTRSESSAALAGRLYLLLNVYFLARGGAMLRRS